MCSFRASCRYFPILRSSSEGEKLKHHEELLKKAVGEKEEGSSSAASSYIQDGQTFLELADNQVGKLSKKVDEEKNVDILMLLQFAKLYLVLSSKVALVVFSFFHADDQLEYH
ncbi:hypothetical protein SUGI_0531960 [Cryptomeria japonica]|nr:hypothetical protein SUGI_0531960 [Cryptomeria japonica]